MRAFWSEPYLWIHLAGIAAVPIFLEICLVSLSIGDPFLPIGIEFLLVAIAGIAPVLWMQWQRPFCIFSLLAVSLKPDRLTAEQRQLLRFFKSQESRTLAIVVAVFLAWVLWQLYQLAPLTTSIAPALPGGRITGLIVTAIAFLLSNLFLQVPVSVIRVLLAAETAVATAEPYPVERVPKDFTLLGLQVRRILPPLSIEPTVAPEAIITTPEAPTLTDAPPPPPDLASDAIPDSIVDTEPVSVDAAPLIMSDEGELGVESWEEPTPTIQSSQDVESATASSLNLLAEPSGESLMEPSAALSMETSTNSLVEPSLESPIEPSEDSPVEPFLESLIEPSEDSPVESSLESLVEPSTDSPVEPSTDSQMHP